MHSYCIIWPPEGEKYHILAKNNKEKFHPLTSFERGPPDPKSDALPPELRGNKGKLQKFLRIYLRLHPVIEFFFSFR